MKKSTLTFFALVVLCCGTCIFAQAKNTLPTNNVMEAAVIQASISPNDDGVNDFFVIQNIDQFPSNELYVFDKSGNLIYHTEYYFNTWDAKKEGKALPEDMYYYVFDDGRGTIQTGYLQVTK